MTTDTSPSQVEQLSRRAWGMLLVLCAALFLDALDVSMVGVALPSIKTDLNMSTSSLQWVVSAYVLGYGGFLLLAGRAADLLGRRRVFLLGLFVLRELRVDAPLVRLGILRSHTLVRANLAAMTLFGGWVGFQFIATLYMQQLRGWSPIETGLAIFPGGLLVAILAPRIAFFVARFGVMKLILAGLASTAIAYTLFVPIGLDSGYWAAILPTVLLAGLGFALAFAPLNIAATTGVAPMEQGLAGGLLNTSFQFGGALFLAIATAVNNANVGLGGTPHALLDGFHPPLVVSVIASLPRIPAIATRPPRLRRELAVELPVEAEVETEAEAA